MEKLSLYIAAVILLLLVPKSVAAAGSEAVASEPEVNYAEKSGFAWGVNAGSAIDLTSNDLSTLNADVYFGVRTPTVTIAALGGGIHAMVSSSGRIYPVYAMLRTSFSRKPQLCFLDLRAGIAFSTLPGSPGQRSFYGAPSLGIRLASGRSFSSYVTVGYTFIGLKSFGTAKDHKNLNGLSMASIGIGISF